MHYTIFVFKREIIDQTRLIIGESTHQRERRSSRECADGENNKPTSDKLKNSPRADAYIYVYMCTGRVAFRQRTHSMKIDLRADHHLTYGPDKDCYFFLFSPESSAGRLAGSRLVMRRR